MQTGKFNTIVDSAWGSSAKGAASTRLVDIFSVMNVSSCNYPNAGHTAIIGDNKFVSKVIPTPAILHATKDRFKDQLKLWIGPGTGLDIKQFGKELKQCEYFIGELVKLHERAMVVSQKHIDAESPSGSQSTEHISSTMSGSGAAMADKMMRGSDVKLVKDKMDSTISPMDFVRGVRDELRNNNTFMHEVSQGWALSINHGTHYPSCTSRDCTPQQAFADFGITKDLIGDIYLNVRTFPIRVGNNFRDGVQTGYSGDCLSDQHETTWAEVGAEAEMPQSEIDTLAEKERTTVTKKIRRVFTPSWQLLRDSASFCGATKMILNFPQYVHWSSYKLRGGIEVRNKLHHKVRAYIDKMEEQTGLPVVMVGTGPEHDDYIYFG